MKSEKFRVRAERQPTERHGVWSLYKLISASGQTVFAIVAFTFSLLGLGQPGSQAGQARRQVCLYLLTAGGAFGEMTR